MDLAKTGKFIQEQRKLKKLTQLQLAKKINVSEKTISKWECGKGFPDTTLMLPLCEALGITANELLSAKLLSESEYISKAEQNLIILKNRQEKSVKHLLSLEWFIGLFSTITYILLLTCGIIVVENFIWKIILISYAVISILIGAGFALKIEQVAGFYQCEHCKHKYIPTYKSVFFAMHIGRTRYLKCPKCGQKSWNKKVIEEE